MKKKTHTEARRHGDQSLCAPVAPCIEETRRKIRFSEVVRIAEAFGFKTDEA